MDKGGPPLRHRPTKRSLSPEGQRSSVGASRAYHGESRRRVHATQTPLKHQHAHRQREEIENASTGDAFGNRLVGTGRRDGHSLEHRRMSFPVFVVWQGTGQKRKGRMVVDIRQLNKMGLTDAYPITKQEGIYIKLEGSEMPFLKEWAQIDNGDLPS